MDTSHPHHVEKAQWWTSHAAKIAFVCFSLIAGFFIVTEHAAHALGALPYLLLALCPLMHVFMHRGHKQHGTDVQSHDEGPKP